MKNQLYTFFFDYKGGTYVSQVKASSPLKALTAWAGALDHTKVDGLTHSAKNKLIDAIAEPLSRVEGVKKTWCFSALLRDHLALVHFTQTKE
jgi:hypothetical protein